MSFRSSPAGPCWAAKGSELFGSIQGERRKLTTLATLARRCYRADGR